MIKEKLIRKGDFKDVVLPIAFGSILIALGQNLFSMPSELLAGGLNGLSLIAEYSFKIPAGIAYFALNVPMVILAVKKMNLRFTMFSFLSVILFSIAQISTAPYIGALKIDDMMLNSIFSGVFRGVGAGFIYRVGASTMGMDVIGALTKRSFNISITTLNMIADFFIMLISAFIYGVEIVLFTVISQYIVLTIADKIMQGVGERKNVMIVTRKHEEITDAIYTKLKRGVTLLNAEGSFTKAPMKVVFTVVSTRQIAKIREIMQEIDENAFMTITESSEVKGKGFKDLG